MKRSALLVFPLLAALVFTSSACNRTATRGGNGGSNVLESQIVVAVIGKQVITMGDIDKLAARELYEAREKALENLITDRVIGAAAGNQSAEDFLRKAVETRVPTVSEAEARAFFEANKARDRKSVV